MDIVRVERLDHLGIVAGVIKDLGIIEAIDARIPPDPREEITTGEAVAGMILNGLGFSSRPMTLTPQFFENKPLEILFRPQVTCEHFNRFKLGRSLDQLFSYGCDLLFTQVAGQVVEKEGISLRYNCLDTTTFSLTGEYNSSSDEHAVVLTHGYSKDHRPDLKQAVLELMVSQDGGVPFGCKSWDGNTSDTEVFLARSKELIKQFARSETPRYLIADSKLYTEENAKNLARLPFITRVPATVKVEGQLITQSLEIGQWQKLDDTTRFTSVPLCHYGIEQRWIVVDSQAAFKRAKKTIAKAQEKEKKQIDKQLFHLAAKTFDSPQHAQAALLEMSSSWKYHRVKEKELTERKKYAKRGKPTPDTPVKALQWQIRVQVEPDWQRIEKQQQQNACFVLATNIPPSQLTDEEIITAYKGQGAVERGFGFLKDPLFFVSSLFLKTPSRIQGLLMVMTLALLVYSMAQRRLRQQLKANGQSLPNQIGQPKENPTLRWVFQMLEGINLLHCWVGYRKEVIVEGITPLRKKILSLFGEKIGQLYQLSPPCCPVHDSRLPPKGKPIDSLTLNPLARQGNQLFLRVLYFQGSSTGNPSGIA